MDEPEIRNMKLKDLRPGRIQHESLPDELLETIHAIYEAIGPFLSMNLEQWELGFMRDMHPEREVAVWCRIAKAWYSYHERFTELKALPVEDEQKLIGVLIGVSTGIREAKDLPVPVIVAERLMVCWDEPCGT
jgi:hypothetical protein